MPVIKRTKAAVEKEEIRRESKKDLVNPIFLGRKQFPKYADLIREIREDEENDDDDETYVNNANNANNNAESLASEEGVTNSATDLPFTEEVVTHFEKILGLIDDIDKTKYIINNLKERYADGIEVRRNLIDNSNQSTRIYPLNDTAIDLPKGSIGYEKNTVDADFDWLFIENGKPPIPLKEIGNGTYGTVFQDMDENIYKETRLELESGQDLQLRCNRFYREFLLEAFIQVVLHNKNPSAVGKIEALYVDYRINRARHRHPRLPVAGETKMVYSFFYKMSKIPYTLRSYATTYGEVKGKKNSLSLVQLSNIFIKLAENLKSFEEYHFGHRDLHMENVMMDESGNPILIDFGMSCLSVAGEVYAVRNDDYGCESYDLPMLMASIYEYNQGLIDTDASNAIIKCMTYGGENIYQTALYRRTNTSSFKRVFHEFYAYRISEPITGMIKRNINLNNLDNFISYWALKKCGSGFCGVMGGGRRIRTRKLKIRKLRIRKSRKAPQIR